MVTRTLQRMLTAFLLLSAVLTATASRKQAKQVLDIICRVNDYWQTHQSPLVRSFWDNAAYHTGNMQAYQLVGNKAWLDYSMAWAEHNLWVGAREKDPSKWLYRTYGEDQQHVLFGDWQICFQTYIDLVRISQGPGASREALLSDPRLARTLEVMSYEANSSANDYWWWADALYMVMPVMTKMYQLTGEGKYLDKLYQNLLYSDSIMLDPSTGLYFRDGKYVYPKHTTVNGKKDFWARGDGWVLAGLAKVLQDMPHHYRHHAFFVQKFQRLAKAVSSLQQPEGYWTRSMMDPAQAPGPETSGTAFFTYGLLWGINHGYLSESTYFPIVKRAWTYLSHVALQPDGSVGYVQPIGERAIPGQQVDSHSQANFGVGAFLLASCEYYHYLTHSKHATKNYQGRSGLFVGAAIGVGSHF